MGASVLVSGSRGDASVTNKLVALGKSKSDDVFSFFNEEPSPQSGRLEMKSDSPSESSSLPGLLLDGQPVCSSPGLPKLIGVLVISKTEYFLSIRPTYFHYFAQVSAVLLS